MSISCLSRFSHPVFKEFGTFVRETYTTRSLLASSHHHFPKSFNLDGNYCDMSLSKISFYQERPFDWWQLGSAKISMETRDVDLENAIIKIIEQSSKVFGDVSTVSSIKFQSRSDYGLPVFMSEEVLQEKVRALFESSFKFSASSSMLFHANNNEVVNIALKRLYTSSPANGKQNVKGLVVIKMEKENSEVLDKIIQIVLANKFSVVSKDNIVIWGPDSQRRTLEDTSKSP